MARKPWELCDDPNSFTGTHQWIIENRMVYNESTGMAKNESKKTPIVICRTCKQQPPAYHRNKIKDAIEEQIRLKREQDRVRRLYQRPRKRR